MKPDPPLTWLDQHTIGDPVAGDGRLLEMVAGHQLVRARAGLPQRFVGRHGRRRDRNLEAVVARLASIALPGMDADDGPIAEQVPCLPRGGRRIGLRGLAERKPVRSGKDRGQVKVGGQKLLLGQFEGEKSGPRKGEAEIGPLPGQLGLDRPLRADLASDKQEVWRRSGGRHDGGRAKPGRGETLHYTPCNSNWQSLARCVAQGGSQTRAIIAATIVAARMMAISAASASGHSQRADRIRITSYYYRSTAALGCLSKLTLSPAARSRPLISCVRPESKSVTTYLACGSKPCSRNLAAS